MTDQSAYRLSAQQEQRWDACGGGDPGRVSLVARVGAVRKEELLASFAAVTARHAIFRTEFIRPHDGRRPLQVIAETAEGAPDGRAVRLELDSTSGDDAVCVRLTANPLNADAETLRLLLRDMILSLPRRGAVEPTSTGFQYLNVSEWQHDLLIRDDAEENLTWWRSKVDAIAPPMGGNRSSGRPGPIKTISFVCPGEVVEAAGDADMPDIALGAWLVTQSLFTGSNRQSVACRFDGRFASELKDVFGPLSRFLPLTTQWSDDESLQGCVALARFAREEAADRQEYFYPPAIERPDPVLAMRLPGYAFSDRASRFRIHDVEIVVLEEEEPPPPSCPWALQCVRDDRTLKGVLHYDGGALSEPAAISMRDAFLRCLAAYAADRQRRARSLRTLPEAAQRRILEKLPAADALRDPVNDMPTPARIMENARRKPGEAAVIHDGRRLSYEELGARASALAENLRDLGIGPDDPVAVLMRGGAEAVVAMLAVLQAGGVYTPLDPSDPPARLESLLNGLKISVALVADRDPVRLAGLNVRPLRVNLNAPAPQNPATPQRPIAPDQGAYIIHTSGSTGEARAVMVPNGALLESTRARQRFYGAPVERFLLASPLIFDSSIAGLFWTLVDGGALIIPGESPANAEELRRLIAEHGVTHLLCIPRLLQAIIDGAAPGELDSLRVVIVAGESCPREIAEAFLAAAPGSALYNEYGVSEAGVWSTVHRVDSIDTDAAPIGAAIPGARVYVCGDELDLAPVGAAGEICIGGLMLARGYVGRPGATAARFLPDPYATRPGDRLYRTGDRARYLDDGRTLLFMGRADNQVKIRGQRVELEQLEAIIRQDLPVAEAAVVLDRRASSPGLMAFYTTRNGNEVTPEQVRAALAARLPEAMVPARISRIDALPRTATGKLDRLSLAEAAMDAPARPASSTPRTPLERKLAEIWAPLLGVAEIGRDDDFFALGGDSIIGLQITARARSAGLIMTPRQVLSCRTIAALAEELEKERSEATAAAGASRTLTPIQRWFFAQDFANPHHYNQALMTEATSDLDIDALRQAMGSVASAHAALQTGFARDAEGWRAIHMPDARDVSVRRLDLAGLAPYDRFRAVREALAETQSSIDLARPPLIRALVIEGDAARPARAMFVAHHLIIDGVSWRIFLDDLAAAYDAAILGDSTVIPPESATPGQWADLLARRAQEPPARALASYWQDDPDDAEAWSLPMDYPGGGNLESDAASVSFTLKPELTRILARAGGERSVDAFALSALGRALAEWRGQDTTWIAVERHGRDIAGQELDLSRTIGWFTAVAPMRLTCRRSLDPANLVADVQEQLKRLPADVWLFDYLRYCETGAESARLANFPQPPVSFNNLGAVRATTIPGLPLRLAQDSCGPLRSPDARRPHFIDVTASTIDDEMTFVITYSAALHAAPTIERIGARMLETLEEICAVTA